MIRKNRHLYGKCDNLNIVGGVDLNRNYGYKFGLDAQGSSNDPCQEDYRGPRAFSEPETQAVRDYVLANKNKIVSSINIHTYGNTWIFPYNYVFDGKNRAL